MWSGNFTNVKVTTTKRIKKGCGERQQQPELEGTWGGKKKLLSGNNDMIPGLSPCKHIPF